MRENHRHSRSLYILVPALATALTAAAAAPVPAPLPAAPPARSIASTPLAPASLRLGALLPLSGRYRPFGQMALEGILTALDWQYPLASGAGGLALAVADSAGDPDQAARGVRDLAERGQVVGIVGPLLTRESLGAASAAREMGVPLVSLSPDPRILSPSWAGSQDTRAPATALEQAPAPAAANTALPVVFRRALTDERQVEELVRFLHGRAGLRKFAILYPQTAYGEKMASLFRQDIEKADVSPACPEPVEGSPSTAVEGPMDRLTEPDPAVVVAAVPFPAGAVDHGPQIRMLAQLDRPWTEEDLAARQKDKKYKIPPIITFEALFVPADYATMGMLARELAYYEVTGAVLFGTNTWNSPELPDRAEQWIEGGIFSAGFFPGRASSATRRFLDRHFLTFGEDATPLQAQAYDAALAMRRGVESGKVKDREGLRAYLAGLKDFPGAEGPLTADSSGDIAQSVTMLQVKGGTFVAAALPARLPSFLPPPLVPFGLD
jgi:branched-chain amino acid transport system substrate-binding protein